MLLYNLNFPALHHKEKIFTVQTLIVHSSSSEGKQINVVGGAIILRWMGGYINAILMIAYNNKKLRPFPRSQQKISFVGHGENSDNL
jgi:hypothetical protein